MASNIDLFLREDMIKADAIFLEAKGYDDAEPDNFDSYDVEKYPAELMINIHKESGDVLLVVLELFTDYIEEAIQALREYPLPWTFSLPSMKIKEKPLEDVLLAIFKKFKNVKLIGE